MRDQQIALMHIGHGAPRLWQSLCGHDFDGCSSQIQPSPAQSEHSKAETWITVDEFFSHARTVPQVSQR